MGGGSHKNFPWVENSITNFRQNFFVGGIIHNNFQAKLGLFDPFLPPPVAPISIVSLHSLPVLILIGLFKVTFARLGRRVISYDFVCGILE